MLRNEYESRVAFLQDFLNKNVKAFISLIASLLMFMQSGFSQNTGFILIKSNPTGAEVFINDRNTLKKTTFQMQMEEGSYKVTLKYDMFHSFEETVVVKKGQTITKEFVLKPAYGNISVNSEPQGADILLDGVLQNQKTPSTLTKIASGKHIINLRKDMYTEGREEVTVEDNQTANILMELQSEYGTIGIVARPDAKILIDGTQVGTSSYSGKLPPGTHKVVLTREKFYPYEEEITIVKGQEKIINKDLKKMVGSLSVMVDPPETDIYINSKFYGLSPKVIDSLIVGDYTLELKKEGYAIFRKKILIEDNDAVQIDTVLQQGKLVRISSSPEGADIIYNGSIAGITPAELVMKDGPNNITIRKKYYRDIPLTINVQKNDQSFSYVLDAELPMVSLNIETYPKKVGIKLNQVGSVDELASASAKMPTGFSVISPVNIQVPVGKYHIKLEKNKFRTIEKEILIEKQEVYKFNLEPVKYRTKGNALLLSLLWPGAGQSYLNRGSAHFLMGFAGYGLLAGAATKYLNSIDDNGSMLEEDSKVFYALEISAGIVWATNFIWTLCMPSEEKKYQKLTLNFNYNNQVGTTQMGLKMNF